MQVRVELNVWSCATEPASSILCGHRSVLASPAFRGSETYPYGANPLNVDFMRTRVLSAIFILVGCTSYPTEQVGSTSAAVVGTWSSAGTLSVARGLFSTELRNIAVADGRVLVVGGGSAASQSKVDVLSATTGAPTAGPALSSAREMFATIALADGSALAAGGQNRVGPNATVLTSAEKWSATSGSWSPTGSLTTARAFASATRLPDGRVLVVGGSGTYLGPGLASAELYDPSSGQFSLTTGAPSLGRFGHVSAILPNGKVFIVGGNTAWGAVPPLSTELFEPTTRTFSSGPNMITRRIAHAGARLLDGRIIYCGGCTTADCSSTAHATCEIYDPTLNTIAATGSLATGGGALSLVTLATGEVLLVGGITNGSAQARAELYDPVVGTWSTAGTMSNARYDSGIALMRDGRAVVSGGRSGSTSGSTYVSSVELYAPATLPITCQICQIDGTCVTLQDGVPCNLGSCNAGACVPKPDAGTVDATPDSTTTISDGSSDAYDSSALDATDSTTADATAYDAVVPVDTAIDTAIVDARADVIVDAQPDVSPAVEASVPDAGSVTSRVDASDNPPSSKSEHGGCSTSGSRSSGGELWFAFAAIIIVTARRVAGLPIHKSQRARACQRCRQDC